MAEGKAEIERIVSGLAWTKFSHLLDSLNRWADLAGDEGQGVLISGVMLDRDLISIRVSRRSGKNGAVDWLEWLCPTSFQLANPLALDHFTAREMQTTLTQLKRREMTGDVRRPHPGSGSIEPGDQAMAAAKKEKPVQPAKAGNAPKTTKPAPAPPPAPAKRSARSSAKPVPTASPPKGAAKPTKSK